MSSLAGFTTFQTLTFVYIFVLLLQGAVGPAILAASQNNHGLGDTGDVRCRQLND